MKFISSLIVFIALSASAVSQQKPSNQGEISGSVEDNVGVPLPYVAIGLYALPDSTYVKGMATDAEGAFSLKVRPGSYFIKCSFLSYTDKIVGPFQVKKADNTNAGTIVMAPNAQVLDMVELTEEKSSMEFQLDKRVFNVGKDMANAGNNAAEVLENVPSVAVDVEGNVSLRGSENVRILIDGRPSGLTGDGNTDGLRMLQGNMIDKIEVITNPSSRQDAEGEVGIINIVLKKEKQEGINGAFELKAGYPENFGASFSLNYRKNWINLFASSGVGYRSSPGYGYAMNEFDNGDTSYFFESNRDQRRGGLSSVSRFGSDIFFNDKNVLTASVLFKYSDAQNTADIEYLDMNSSKELINSTLRSEAENEVSVDFETNLLYKKTFDRKGQEWTTMVIANQNDDSEESMLDQTISNGSRAGTSYQRSSNTEDQRQFIAQTDYIHPIGPEGKFETGLKASLREISNAYNVDLRDTGAWYNLTAFSNELIYNENIYAGYAMHSNKREKVSYQFGLRSEYSDIKTKLVRTSESNPRSYLSFFPSAHLSYELNDTNSFQASYSRRISRPRFRELIPFFSYTDPRNFYSGNPDLNPEFTDSYEIGYLRQFCKGSLLTSVYYRHTKGPTERITLTDSNGFIRRFPVNLSTQDAYGFELNFQYEVSKWLRANINTNVYQANRQGVYQGTLYRSSTLTASGRGSFMFKLPYDIKMQVSGNYRAPRVSTQGRVKQMYSIDAGLSKEVLKGNGTITFSAKDIFNTRVRRWEVDTDELYSESEFQWRARQFMLIFNYRLNQKKSNRRDRILDDSSDDM